MASLGPRVLNALYSGGWLLLVLLLFVIAAVTPLAAPFAAEHQGAMHGWASEGGVHGAECQALQEALRGGLLANVLTEPRVETMLWGEAHEYRPVDYAALVETVCEAEAAGAASARRPLPYKGRGSPFATRVGRELHINGSAFRYVGFNAPQLLSLAAEQGPRLAAADAMMAHAAQLGLRVARVWAFRDGYDWRPPNFRQQAFSPLQIAPGQYNESMFQALDHVIAAAGRAGVYVTLTVSNWHRDYGGLEAYVKWAKGGSDLSGWTVYDFYTDARVRTLFKANLAALASRVNSVTGRAYRDDPTIFSWDLLNEPRCSACPGGSRSDALVAWAAEMSRFMKAVAPRQLVTVSSEGYWGESTLQLVTANPGLWAVCEGVDFDRLYRLPALDYSVAHLYLAMKTWDDAARVECDADCAFAWSRQWMTAHLAYAEDVLAKPFVLEEFGLPRGAGSKDGLFRLVYDTLRGALHAGRQAVAGSNFWAAAVEREPDWDGYYLYLDGSLPAPTPLGEALGAEQQAYWDALQAAGDAFRRKEEAEACYEEVKAKYAYLLDSAADMHRAEADTATLEIVAQAVSTWNSIDARGGARGQPAA